MDGIKWINSSESALISSDCLPLPSDTCQYDHRTVSGLKHMAVIGWNLGGARTSRNVLQYIWQSPNFPNFQVCRTRCSHSHLLAWCQKCPKVRRQMAIWTEWGSNSEKGTCRLLVSVKLDSSHMVATCHDRQTFTTVVRQTSCLWWRELRPSAKITICFHLSTLSPKL